VRHSASTLQAAASHHIASSEVPARAKDLVVTPGAIHIGLPQKDKATPC
jgi:hypothetical protein